MKNEQILDTDETPQTNTVRVFRSLLNRLMLIAALLLAATGVGSALMWRWESSGFEFFMFDLLVLLLAFSILSGIGSALFSFLPYKALSYKQKFILAWFLIMIVLMLFGIGINLPNLKR